MTMKVFTYHLEFKRLGRKPDQEKNKNKNKNNPNFSPLTNSQGSGQVACEDKGK